MEQQPTANPLLELIDRPAFCVRNGIIIQANQAARQIQIAIGTPIRDMLADDLQAYESFNDGCLSISLNHLGTKCMTSVTRTEDYDIFRIEQGPDLTEFRILALVAQHIRAPLATALTVTDDIFSQNDSDPRAAQLNRALFQLQRMICNISDVARYSEISISGLRTVNLSAMFDEIFEKAAAILEQAGLTLHYTGLNQIVFGLADEEKLSRAVYNILSNAAKFAPKGSVVEAKLTKNGNMLHFTVQDEGEGIPQEIIGNVFSRFLRQPGIEDGRNGIGLGIPLVHAVAAAHGGTVLIDHPEGHGARVTMTIAIRSNSDETLRQNILTVGDYTGGRDMALLELSDILPAKSYKDIN